MTPRPIAICLVAIAHCAWVVLDRVQDPAVGDVDIEVAADLDAAADSERRRGIYVVTTYAAGPRGGSPRPLIQSYLAGSDYRVPRKPRGWVRVGGAP